MQTYPVAIGGIGGSGTRVIAEILKELGYYLGDDLNDALDNLTFTLLFKRLSLWPIEIHQDEISRLLRLFLNIMTDRLVVSSADIQLLDSCVAESTLEHPRSWREERLEKILLLRQNTIRQEGFRWGWKEPNTHILLPELRKGFPAMKYVHVMRHGLDMALSSNQNQLKLWGEKLLGREVEVDNPSDSLRYWCASHRRLLTLKKEMGGDLLLLNFDKFCESPRVGVQTLMTFFELDLDDSLSDRLCSNIQIPESAGRYKKVERSLFRREDLAFVAQMGFVI